MASRSPQGRYSQKLTLQQLPGEFCPTRKLIWEPTNLGVLGAEFVVSGREEIERVHFLTQNPSLTSNTTPPSSELDIAAATVFKAVPEGLKGCYGSHFVEPYRGKRDDEPKILFKLNVDTIP